MWGPTGDPQAVSFVVPGHRVVARSGPARAAARANSGARRRTADGGTGGADAEDDDGGGADGLSGLPAGFEERTGSSVATALAAGLAALVLHCVRLAAIQGEAEGGAAAVRPAAPAAAAARAGPTVQFAAAATAVPGATSATAAAAAPPAAAAAAGAGAVRASDLARLREHEGMLGALRAVGLADGGGQHARFIEVWRRFDAPAQALRAVGARARTRRARCASWRRWRGTWSRGSRPGALGELRFSGDMLYGEKMLHR